MVAPPQSDPFASARHEMIENQLRARGVLDPRVLDAMSRVLRHEFVLPARRAEAYEDHPLPIGEGQTISQPLIVAVALQSLSLGQTDRVLEVGTGSGYQTALLAELSQHVYSVERHASLAEAAQQTLSRLGYKNVTITIGDGSRGMADHAPYDAIMVSAAAPRIPPPLFDQLKEAGRMVIPVGPEQAQQLQLVEKKNGAPVITVLEPCRFVPLIGQEAYPK